MGTPKALVIKINDILTYTLKVKLNDICCQIKISDKGDISIDYFLMQHHDWWFIECYAAPQGPPHLFSFSLLLYLLHSPLQFVLEASLDLTSPKSRTDHLKQLKNWADCETIAFRYMYKAD